MRSGKCFGLCLILVVGLLATVPALADNGEIPALSYPVFTTSAGQSADIITLNILVEEAGIGYDYCDVPDVEMLSTGVGLGGAVSGPGFHVEYMTDTEAYPVGTPFGTLIVVIGASLKGMGASGLTVDDEVARVESILAYCQENDVTVVAVHVAGYTGRGAPGSDNERMIDCVAPYADCLIVAAEGNEDDRFTVLAEEQGISLIEIEYALGLVDVLKTAFSVEE